MIGTLHQTKLLGQAGGGRQADQGTVNAQYPVALPTAEVPPARAAVGHGEQYLRVQFDIGRGAQFSAGAGKGPRGYRAHQAVVVPLVQELVQVALQGFDAFLEDTEYDDGKVEDSLAQEGFGIAPVALQESGLPQPAAQGLKDEGGPPGGGVVGNRWERGLHRRLS